MGPPALGGAAMGYKRGKTKERAERKVRPALLEPIHTFSGGFLLENSDNT